MPELLPVEEALAGVLRVAATEAIAVVPESAQALPAGAPVELWLLDRP